MQRDLSTLTQEQRAQYHAYRRAGYSIVLLKPNGEMCPGYTTKALLATLAAVSPEDALEIAALPG